LSKIAIDPTNPALFLLSGGPPTGIPTDPRTHNDYTYNQDGSFGLRRASRRCLCSSCHRHNLPLACPGLQGFMLRGARVVLEYLYQVNSHLPLIERHKISHIHVVPALLIRWINDPTLERYDLASLRVIQSGGHGVSSPQSYSDRTLLA